MATAFVLLNLLLGTSASSSFLFPLRLSIYVFKSQLLILDKFFIHRFTLRTSLFQLLFQHLFQKRVGIRCIQFLDASTKADLKLCSSTRSVRYWLVRALLGQCLSLEDIKKMTSMAKGVLLINIVVQPLVLLVGHGALLKEVSASDILVFVVILLVGAASL